MDQLHYTPPYPPHVAADKYEHFKSRSLARFLLHLLGHESRDRLLSFDEVQQLLRSRVEMDRGTQIIPIDHIVGSVGRYRDFTRAFLPLSGADKERWERLDVALNELQSLPPIEVYKIGDVYFVRDGNHRVSVAKANGLTHIEAHVTEIETVAPLTPDVNIDDLIIKTEYAQFQKATELNLSRRGAEICLTEPGRYQVLLDHIEVHRYYMGLDLKRDVSLPEAAVDWYDHVYLPVVKAIRASKILQEFPDRTEADLYFWVAYHRERLRQRYGKMPPNEEVANILADRFSGRPMTRLWKMLRRAVHAATRAAAESPEPPVAGEPPTTPADEHKQSGQGSRS